MFRVSSRVQSPGGGRSTPKVLIVALDTDMAVVPALATMAALTLLQNPAAQPEGVSVDYSPFAGPARRIQRAIRRLLEQRTYTRDVWRAQSRAFDSSLAGYPTAVPFHGPGYGVVSSLRSNPARQWAVYDWDAMRRSIF